MDGWMEKERREREETPITFRSISGFALPSVIHNNQPPLPIFETSATALCGTTGKKEMRVKDHK